MTWKILLEDAPRSTHVRSAEQALSPTSCESDENTRRFTFRSPSWIQYYLHIAWGSYWLLLSLLCLRWNLQQIIYYSTEIAGRIVECPRLYYISIRLSFLPLSLSFTRSLVSTLLQFPLCLFLFFQFSSHVLPFSLFISSRFTTFLYFFLNQHFISYLFFLLPFLLYKPNFLECNYFSFRTTMCSENLGHMRNV